MELSKSLKKYIPKLRWYLLVIFLVADVFLLIYVFNLKTRETFSVNFLDVGQGDAAYINLPGSAQVLIDTGPSSDILSTMGAYMPFFDRTIDLMILSHYDSDHMRGALSLLKRYNVSRIIGPGKTEPTPEYTELQKLIKEKDIDFIPAQYGLRLVFNPAAYMDIIVPQNADLKEPNFSVLAKMVYGGRSFLFTGDSEFKEENELLKEKFNLMSDVLKIAHHGSKYATSAEFLNAVGPALSVISVGANNRYGHPSAELLQRMAGIDILRTDLLGDIKIISDGSNIYKSK
jgi:competence protein ComEC